MSTFYGWARRWGIPPEAINELLQELRVGHMPESPKGAKSESGASNHVRLQAAHQGDILWRNNVGRVTPDTYDGVSYISFGLANDSMKMNKHIKSSDLIGIRQRLITMEMVGSYIGQFVAREVKKPGWKYTGTEHEKAQLRYMELVISMGGDAAFTTGNYL